MLLKRLQYCLKQRHTSIGEVRPEAGRHKKESKVVSAHLTNEANGWSISIRACFVEQCVRFES